MNKSTTGYICGLRKFSFSRDEANSRNLSWSFLFLYNNPQRTTYNRSQEPTRPTASGPPPGQAGIKIKSRRAVLRCRARSFALRSDAPRPGCSFSAAECQSLSSTRQFTERMRFGITMEA